MSAKKIDYMENKQLKNESIYGVGNWFKRYYPDEWFFELILKKVIWNWETICRGCQAVEAIWLLGGPGDNSRPTGEPIPASISARQTSALHLIKFQMAWGPCRYRPTTSQKYIKHSLIWSIHCYVATGFSNTAHSNLVKSTVQAQLGGQRYSGKSRSKGHFWFFLFMSPLKK